jgi:hypothetical protein
MTERRGGFSNPALTSGLASEAIMFADYFKEGKFNESKQIKGRT